VKKVNDATRIGVADVQRQESAHTTVRATSVTHEGPPSTPADPDQSNHLTDQQRLVGTLCKRLRSGGSRVRLLETHISFVLLTGAHAYKIKKAVKLGFLDFSTLASRRLFCEEELRLNRRLAPALYLDVVPITGTLTTPVVGGGGRVLEYAVRMREFPQEALLSNVLDRAELTPAHVDAIAAQVAVFHARAGVATPDSRHGEPSRVLRSTLANFAEIAPLVTAPSDRAALRSLKQWTRREYATVYHILERRHRDGSIRECHGDLHLGNIALVDHEVTIFDCIEFNEAMRWIDTMSEVAFTVMDLEHRKHADLAYRFLTAYCERSGDYRGAAVLRFYLVYRAMVRAKVACLRASQLPNGAGRATFQADFAAHLSLASSYANDARPTLVLMHGPSGSGKTTLSQLLLERAGALRIRTDVERKRLAGLAASARSGSTLAGGLYAPDATKRTYDHVLASAEAVVQGGFTALVDGAFLRRWQRDMFRELAAERELPFVIVDCVASEATLKARVSARASAGKDASEADVAVLAHQLSTGDALACDELRFTLSCDAEGPFLRTLSPTSWRNVIERIHANGAPPGRPRSLPSIDTALAAKVTFLSHPRSYPERTGIVESVETHRSWVFLTEQHAYKLKKPVHDDYMDMRSVEARRRNCIEELRVNRRFGSDVYLDVVSLTRGNSGELRIGGRSEAVDWLLRMRRLPAHQMLDRIIVSGRFHPPELVPVVELLCRVYAESTVTQAEEDYRRRLIESALANERELCRPEFGLPVDVVKQVCVRQLRFLDQQAGYFHDRVRASRIVEGHGDLRPEHICLDAAPHILDSLEFSRDLRTLDVVDELGFLALECERLGAPQARRYIFSAYRRTTGDAPPDPLIHFYQSFRAAVRAMLAIRHLLDPGTRDVHRWPVQARRYLELALTHIERCDSGATASKSIAARPRVRRRLVGAPTQRSSNKETP
jgi:aminoglycoside phosphotransferase family enzyme